MNELLDHLRVSGYGVYIDDIYCGVPMYADNLTLISTSASDLQLQLDMVSAYALHWRYLLNAQKSSILVLASHLSLGSRIVLTGSGC